MNLRQIKNRVRYLRKLYADLDAHALAARTPMGRERYALAAKHLKGAVAFMLDGFDSERGKL
jgi:hypothetical protein